MKKSLTLFLVFLSAIAIAQKRQNVYFIKNEIPTGNQKTADYRRVIQEPDSGSTLYNVYEFYPDNTEKTIGFVSIFEPMLVYEGRKQSFNKKGTLIADCNYENGKLSGKAVYFYENGKPRAEFFHEPSIAAKGVAGIASARLINAYDSLGNQTVKDGTGKISVKEKYSNEEGSYVNGYKDGNWTGELNGNRYEEKFSEGKMVSGTAYLSDGNTKNYTVSDELPSFPNGLAQFYKYLGKNYRFPTEAFRAGISGKLYITFVVEKDGRLSDYDFKNDLGYGTRQEAIRVLDQSPRWHPGTQHGIPVRVKYNININLSR
ncbi:energy transducer TonB [Pedobacter sp. AW1-32]|uniref:energy transducer TonB n=1 Tax=Pedobacter sp. AW1-32 TaxID=3383026 RepID=UPI003FEF52D4